MKSRAKRILDGIKGNVDAVLIFNGTQPMLDMTFYYVTGLVDGIFEGSLAVIFPDAKVELITSTLEAESAKKARVKRHIFGSSEERDTIIKDILKGTERIGINAAELTHKNYLKLKKLLPKRKFVDISEAIQNARMIKDKREIEYIRRACEIASHAASYIIPHITEGVKEYEIAAELDYTMQKLGATEPAFTTIVAFGSNSAEPHYTHGDTSLQRGQFVLLDFGPYYRKYAGDITRTYFFGRAKREHKEMYGTVLEAQQLALDMIKDGENGRDIDRKIREFIDKTKYKGRFIHSLGHSLGLAVHDGGAISSNVDQTLKEGMVFTVEPGIYIPGVGGVRIEDDVLIKKSGVEVLTHAPKEFVEL